MLRSGSQALITSFLRRVLGWGLAVWVLACAATPPAPTATVPQPASTPADTPTTQPTLTPAADPFVQRRQAMVDTQLRSRDITDAQVLAVMEKVPRHEFVPADVLAQSYEDHPLPIGYGQTISQPYIVGLMTQLLNLKRGEKVLEIGTGSGYQAAILAELTDQVYTVEIIPELAQRAEGTLRRLGYSQVQVKTSDGYFGWEEHAPFDAIIVTAAPDHVPQPLIQQLKDGGRLVIPVGPPGSFQTLWQITRQGDQLVSRNITGVIFVPLVRERR